MSHVIDLDRIKQVLPRIDLVDLIEQGFVEYSRGNVVVPPVGELLFENPPGDVHIKYGYIKGDDHYVIKIASGFYNNPQLGLPSSQGLMLLFSQKTGSLQAILLDEGHLTNIRTAAAGAVAARHLAPQQVHRIGVLGAGIQARLQLEYLRQVTPCRNALVWVPVATETESFLEFFADSDFSIEIAETPGQVAARCNLIVTTTPATAPLLAAHEVAPGTHITAVGSDTADKIELDPGILARADFIIADSLRQSESRGEVFRAVTAGAISRDRVAELGAVISQESTGRANDTQISVCDLTGVAVQDIQIAKAVYHQIKSEVSP